MQYFYFFFFWKLNLYLKIQIWKYYESEKPQQKQEIHNILYKLTWWYISTNFFHSFILFKSITFEPNNSSIIIIPLTQTNLVFDIWCNNKGNVLHFAKTIRNINCVWQMYILGIWTDLESLSKYFKQWRLTPNTAKNWSVLLSFKQQTV